ncbi:hypothetical protein Poli38472_001953 [Pythium oligandrum]|uniref:FYVE-type domain-containing protein n=1 Tax=Pythium oligandrum TaxID=41045 RepID=A0A8K1FS91_PYTOL|nr:hypothetical protein Poli38472_001953 [Pythium oligandrum]|eukprot:TMW69797.1 hypothetical protein Poli38472_001953 [Pythium oligandrum]
MKFPLQHNPFPPLKLSQDYIDSLLRLEQSIVDQTVAEFEQFAYVQNRVVDKTKWKHVKTRENMHVYRAIGDHSDDPHLIMQEMLLDASASSNMATSRMNVKGGARLIAVGSVVGRVNDALFIDGSHTEEEMQIRSSYVPDECVDWRVLYNLCEPTHDNPLHTSMIKYHVMATTGAAGLAVRPRDLVMLNCTGETILSNGERVGYGICHSLDVPGCGTVEGIVRAQASCSYIFRAQGRNSAEVYMRMVSEMGGNVNDSIAALSFASSMIAIWKMPWGGQNVKLAWMLKQQRRNRSRKESSHASDCCQVCQRSFSLMRTDMKCGLCRELVCSSCLVVRKISYVRPGRHLLQVPTGFCKHCILQASLLDAADIARKEYVPKQASTRSGGFSSVSSTTPTTHMHDSVVSDGSSASPSSGVDLRDAHVETVEDWEKAQYDPQGTVYSPLQQEATNTQQLSAGVGVDQHQMNLLLQMEQLRLAAEQTYQLTMENERAMNGI